MNEQYDDLDELPAPPRKDIPEADRQLLELAARALGAQFTEVDGEGYGNLHFANGEVVHAWNPLTFHGDTFELAADLGLQTYPVARTTSGATCSAVGDCCGRRLSEVSDIADIRAATARAVVLAAAEIGKSMSSNIEPDSAAPP